MSEYGESSLSRAVSSIDLNAALTATQINPRPPRYTMDTIVSLRSGEEHVDQEDYAHELSTNGAIGEGIITPPNFVSPRPPPPTPASLNFLPTPPATEVANSHLSNANGNGEVAEFAGDRADGDQSDDELAANSKAVEELKKKKKKRSGKTKKPAPTGFEEYYADTPITPEEFNEELELYAEHQPFHQRIETCIQRYRARRNLDSTRSNILTKYLMLGGIEGTTKMFNGGLDQETIDDSNADQIRDIQATDFVRGGSKKYYDPADAKDWVVDFEGVAAGFFSYRVPRIFPLDTRDELRLCCAVIRNFLNYVLNHAVCKEYTIEIMNAKKICDKAENELWAIKQIRGLAPGQFNSAASTLYGGRYQEINLGVESWGSNDPSLDATIEILGYLSVPEAERIFKTAIATYCDETMFTEINKPGVTIVNTEERAYELVSIERASVDNLEICSQAKDHDGHLGQIKPLGVMKVKAWIGPGFVEEEEYPGKNTTVDEDKIEAFFIEDEILQHFIVGMKMELTVHELSVGIKFFDHFIGVYCSFHTMLENEKMADWKEPAPNTRPPPTEDDPDSEERAMQAAMNDEFEREEKTVGA